MTCVGRAASEGAWGLGPTARLHPTAPLPLPRQVWDFQRSAEMRDTEGGASRRSVLEQAAKLRAYLAEKA